MRMGTATIISAMDNGLRAAASSAQISTTEGSALAIFEKRKGGERDQKLVKKVLSSGHKSLIEHMVFTVAFDDVSVLTEQFMIEARLNSFTVKSRRYVDFQNAGYVVPVGLTPEQKNLYREKADELFGLYGILTAAGIPKEDARFVLPYCFCSNFYMTLNARTLLSLIYQMTEGRGKDYSEIHALGKTLAAQFENYLPGVIDSERSCGRATAVRPMPENFCSLGEVQGDAEIVYAPANAENMLMDAMAFSGRYPLNEKIQPANVDELLTDGRARELETINYTMRIKNVSLACVTHFVRHRMQSIQVPDTIQAAARGGYPMPESIAQNPEAKAAYTASFARQADDLRRLRAAGISMYDLAYFARGGNTTDLYITMNAREINHFMKLRTCTRAQWEIRQVAEKMLDALKEDCPAIFTRFGPSCYVDGKCPEGRLTCGNPRRKDA